MSDERQQAAILSGETYEECAPTERDPARATPARAPLTPSRGVALSVLWWLEGNESSSDWTD